MTVIETQQKIIKSFSEPIIKRLVNNVVRSLQKLDITMSGMEKGNTWDDICIQVQSELSSYWPAHEETIKGFIQLELQKMAYHEKMAIWFQTVAGQKSVGDELFNLEEKEGIDDSNEPGYFEPDVVNHLFAVVWRKADNWNNYRIRKYLEK
jgi:hypothetical protein